MELKNKKSQPILQRRNNLSNLVQQLLDGIAVIGVTWGLVQYHYVSIGGATGSYMILLFALLANMALTYDKFAIYRSNAKFVDKALTLLNAWSLTFLLLMLLAFLTKQTEVYSRFFIAQLFVFGYFAQLFFYIIFRALYKKFGKHTQKNERVLIVGQSQLAKYLEQKISSNPWIGEEVIGFVTIPNDELSFFRRKASGRVPDPEALGSIDNLPALIEEHNIGTIYIVTSLESSKSLEKIYKTTLDKYVTINWIPNIFSLRLLNHSVRELSGMPVITLSQTPMIGIGLILKSIEDKVLSSLILILISPLLLLVALAVKLDSPGPIFFRQNRAGWGGKPFKIWKFRSMHVHQEGSEKLKQAEKNDSRITRVGAFIRKTSLDELPQLFNVLTGDMSLVGPRPHAMQHDEEYSQRIFDYFSRHHIKPGITGLAQVRGLRGETKDIDQMVRRIESDIEYINNWSLLLDIKIIFLTVFKLSGETAY
jgi:putative colanic acid biosynthesis UDP-glucose lipid carrier transferase